KLNQMWIGSYKLQANLARFQQKITEDCKGHLAYSKDDEYDFQSSLQRKKSYAKAVCSPQLGNKSPLGKS
ncbi:hypothetical protein Ancab_013353, partial [Ancistrocladus abbreviatus]